MTSNKYDGSYGLSSFISMPNIETLSIFSQGYHAFYISIPHCRKGFPLMIMELRFSNEHYFLVGGKKRWHREG